MTTGQVMVILTCSTTFFNALLKFDDESQYNEYITPGGDTEFENFKTFYNFATGHTRNSYAFFVIVYYESFCHCEIV